MDTHTDLSSGYNENARRKTPGSGRDCSGALPGMPRRCRCLPAGRRKLLAVVVTLSASTARPQLSQMSWSSEGHRQRGFAVVLVGDFVLEHQLIGRVDGLHVVNHFDHRAVQDHAAGIGVGGGDLVWPVAAAAFRCAYTFGAGFCFFGFSPTASCWASSGSPALSSSI